MGDDNLNLVLIDKFLPSKGMFNISKAHNY